MEKIKFLITNEKPLLVRLEDADKEALQDFLNTINSVEAVDKFILDCEVIVATVDLDQLVLANYNDYWEDENLGKCFTLAGYDNGIDVFINENDVYIEDEYQYPEVPRVRVSLERFKGILGEWKQFILLNS